VSLPIYRDIEGGLHEKKEVDWHHVFGQSLAHGKNQRKFINRFGLKERMLKRFHNDHVPEALHENMGLLRPPQGLAMAVMGEFMDNYSEHNPYDRLIGIAGYVGDMAVLNNNREVRREFGRISEHLTLQLPFILRGQVEVIPDTRTSGQN